MERTPHALMVGEGARKFAREQGFEDTELLTKEQRNAWLKWQEENPERRPRKSDISHDTLTLLVLGGDGNIAGGSSTSGWAYKMPGRVGDSPILGGGLYVDNDLGAAGATGTGENIMRYCGSYSVVEGMRQGLHPAEACAETIRSIARKDPLGYDLDIHFVALDKRGRYGAAGTSKEFPYAVTTKASSRVLRVAATREPRGCP